MLALDGNVSSALCSLVDGTGLACHLWPQSGALVTFCLFAPGCLMENTVVYRGWLVFPHSSFVFKLHEEAWNPSGVGFVFRLVEGQTLPLMAGFSKCLPCVVFLSWQGCSLGGWAALFFHPNSPVIPIQGKVAAFTAATSVQRSRVCGCVCRGAWVWEVRAISPVSSGQVKERRRRSPLEW